MTAMLGCDGCGAIASDRGDDPTRSWFALSASPTIGAGLLPMIDFTTTPTFLDVNPDEPEPDEEELDEPEPDRHFCSLACLASWVDRALGLAQIE